MIEPIVEQFARNILQARQQLTQAFKAIRFDERIREIHFLCRATPHQVHKWARRQARVGRGEG